MSPFRRLAHQRRRLAAIAVLADRYDRPDLVVIAHRYAVRLNGWAGTLLPADAAWLGGMLGRNGLGPSIDDLASSVKRERRLARRVAMHGRFMAEAA